MTAACISFERTTARSATCLIVFRSVQAPLWAFTRNADATEGVAEAENPTGQAYGDERLSAIATRSPTLELHTLVQSFVRDLVAFQSGLKRRDYVTVAASRRQ